MVDIDGSFSIDWDSKLSELRHAATKAYAKENPTRGAMDHRVEIKEGSAEWNKIHNSYEWIAMAFDSLRELPHPKQSKAMADNIAKVAGNNDMTDLVDDEDGENVGGAGGVLSGKALTADVNSNIAAWTGDGATSFKVFFGDVPGVIDNQANIAKFLGWTMELNWGLLKCARKDAEKIPEAAIASLEALSASTSADDGGTILTIAAAVSTVAAGLATLPAGGAAIAAGGLTILAGISSGAAVVDTAEGKADKEMPIKGDTVEQVLSGMVETISTVGLALTDGENKIIEKLDATTEVLQGPKRGEFVAPGPNVFIGGGSGQFRPG